MVPRLPDDTSPSRAGRVVSVGRQRSRRATASGSCGPVAALPGVLDRPFACAGLPRDVAGVVRISVFAWTSADCHCVFVVSGTDVPRGNSWIDPGCYVRHLANATCAQVCRSREGVPEQARDSKTFVFTARACQSSVHSWCDAVVITSCLLVFHRIREHGIHSKTKVEFFGF